MDFNEKYRITEYENALFEVIKRKRAYWDLVEVIAEDEFYGIETTDEQVERIIDKYLEAKREGDDEYLRDNELMRNAIASVTEREYTLEVHSLFYDTVTVLACSEREAHEMARERYRGGVVDGDHFIRAVACGTVKVDDEEVDNDNGEHTTEWE